jgi:hypothetical protein
MIEDLFIVTYVHISEAKQLFLLFFEMNIALIPLDQK